MSSAYKTRYFSRWAEKAGLADAALLQAVAEMEAGLIDADLGGGLIKKRVPLPGRGKRGGARTIVATNWAGRWFFVAGYEKSTQETIEKLALEALQIVASSFLVLNEEGISTAIKAGTLQGIPHEQIEQRNNLDDARDND